MANVEETRATCKASWADIELFGANRSVDIAQLSIRSYSKLRCATKTREYWLEMVNRGLECSGTEGEAKESQYLTRLPLRGEIGA